MRSFLRRTLIVCLAGLAALLLLEACLTRDEGGARHLAVEATGTDASGEPVHWTLEITELGAVRVDGRDTTLAAVIEDLRSTEGELKLTASGRTPNMSWEAILAPGGVTLRGAAATMADLESLLMASAPEFKPTKAVTVADVLAAAERGEVLMPTRSKVSLPGFSYKDAFPEATDEPEIVIEKYSESPWLADRNLIPRPEWRKYYPESLPPVAERLPRNPAVVTGPDGLGRYGGSWLRTGNASAETLRKICPETFIRFDPAGRIQPALAYKWDIADNNRVYTFHLRKGHKWSDGRPFTVQDILFVTEKIIGSAYWATMPDWMQPSDGSTMLYVEDVLDWPALRALILAGADSAGASVGRQLLDVGGEDFKKAVADLPVDEAPALIRQHSIIDQINKILRDVRFFDATGLGNIDFGGELNALKKRGFSRLGKQDRERLLLLMDRNALYQRALRDIKLLSDAELSRLNLLMFRANAAGVVDIARKKRVKIEAVADETGDDSHIIRFTFPRPNAIFLEKTATFMFYRGLFGMQAHFYNPVHPEGMTELAVTDILDWTALTETIQRHANEANSGPSKRLWSMLDESIKERIAVDPPADDSPAEYKQAIVDAVNTVLRGRAYYDAAAWKSVDFEAAYNDVVAGDFSLLQRNRNSLNLATQLLKRADLLERVGREGIGSLTDEEVLDLNVFCFRAAYDRHRGHELVAINREQGLNVAAQNHPDVFTTWVYLARDKGKFDSEINPHPPTLAAWRSISDKLSRTHVAVRNPYYYKVDATGAQLPYIDVIESRQETNPANIMLSLASGGSGFQSRELTWEHFSFLKSHEFSGGERQYEIRVWANDYVGEVNLFFLQARKEGSVLTPYFTEARFRHAMSMAINRQEIIDVVFKGLGEPAQSSVPYGSPYYNEKLATISVDYDPAKANRILDDLGLTERTADGIRKLPDGTPFVINIDCQDKGGYPLPAIEMICSYWRDVGINAQMKVRTHPLITRMCGLGILDVGISKEGGNFRGPLDGGNFAPTHPAEAVQWTQWVNYIHSGGRTGWTPPDWLRDIDRMWDNVVGAESEEAKFAAWQKLAERNADDLPMIGLMTSPGKMVYVRKNFKNVPKIAIAGWIAHEPANCCPEVFYIDQE